MKGDHLYGRTDMHGCFAIYFLNPCFRVLMACDKYTVFETMHLKCLNSPPAGTVFTIVTTKLGGRQPGISWQ